MLLRLHPQQAKQHIRIDFFANLVGGNEIRQCLHQFMLINIPQLIK